ncbi:MAG: FtsX-like permease family protein [Eisenbergiella sp.]
MTLSKLSLRNARRQARDYLVYFVTIVMSAALIYAFNGLVFLNPLSAALEVMPLIIVLASIVVVCIIGWLVQYTSSFMLTRRGRELGTYILTGLENSQVARLFFLENLAVGGIALLLGTILGNLIFQALRAVMLTLFRAPYTFRFSFSLNAVLLTIFYFALVYLFALFRSRRRIRTMKICDLIYSERQNEKELLKNRSRRKIFVCIHHFRPDRHYPAAPAQSAAGILGSACIIVFLYGFYRFSSGVPAYFDKRPGKNTKATRC